MPYDEGLAERVREAFEDVGEVRERKMFGGIAFMVAGHMSCGIVKQTLMVRVGPERYEEAMAHPHTREMDFTGRSLKGYVYVEPAGFAEDEDLRAWIRTSLEYVQSLPPKAPEAGRSTAASRTRVGRKAARKGRRR